MKAKAIVTADEVALSSSGFRTRIFLGDNESIDRSYFPTLGYGYRHLGKDHRGFIACGPQARILLHSGNQYEVSVESVDDFRSGVSAAKNGNTRR
ncbi:hypothetical protein [Arthrobacter sp. VKM Ac-2550]|uniref:hypothetical protein n=1 Tax=Crystallibacter permensis TaxID=1938888 RepID=UPI0022267DAB|nr:hypothetical protein [Arthrobacter sp. VKM Ac-2550]MCW2131704.1 hypothetical protein [Arthrobacter sp. VKM Ac-2550]